MAIFDDATEVGGRQRQAPDGIIFVTEPRFVLRPEGAGQRQASGGPGNPHGFEAAVIRIGCHGAAQIVWTEQEARHGIAWGREPIGLPAPQERERHIDGVIQPGLGGDLRLCGHIVVSGDGDLGPPADGQRGGAGADDYQQEQDPDQGDALFWVSVASER